MQIKCLIAHPSKLAKAAFGNPPEAFNAVDVNAPAHELIVHMRHLEMLAIADINQAIIAAPAIGVNDTIEGDATPNNGLQRGFSAVRHDFGIDLAVAFDKAEHGGFAGGAPSAFALDALRARWPSVRARHANTG